MASGSSKGGVQEVINIVFNFTDQNAAAAKQTAESVEKFANSLTKLGAVGGIDPKLRLSLKSLTDQAINAGDALQRLSTEKLSAGTIEVAADRIIRALGRIESAAGKTSESIERLGQGTVGNFTDQNAKNVRETTEAARELLTTIRSLRNIGGIDSRLKLSITTLKTAANNASAALVRLSNEKLTASSIQATAKTIIASLDQIKAAAEAAQGSLVKVGTGVTGGAGTTGDLAKPLNEVKTAADSAKASVENLTKTPIEKINTEGAKKSLTEISNVAKEALGRVDQLGKSRVAAIKTDAAKQSIAELATAFGTIETAAKRLTRTSKIKLNAEDAIAEANRIRTSLGTVQRALGELRKSGEVPLIKELGVLNSFRIIEDSINSTDAALRRLSSTELGQLNTAGVTDPLERVTTTAGKAAKATQQVADAHAQAGAAAEDSGKKQQQSAQATTAAADAHKQVGVAATESGRKAGRAIESLSDRLSNNIALVREGISRFKSLGSSASVDLAELGRVQKFITANQRALSTEITNTDRELAKLNNQFKRLSPGDARFDGLQKQIQDLQAYSDRLKTLDNRQARVANTVSSFNTTLQAQQKALQSSTATFAQAATSTNRFSSALKTLSESRALPNEKLAESGALLKQLRTQLQSVQTQYAALQAVRGTGNTEATRAIDAQVGKLQRLEGVLSSITQRAEGFNKTFAEQTQFQQNTEQTTKALQTLNSAILANESSFKSLRDSGRTSFGNIVTAADRLERKLTELAGQPFITPQGLQQIDTFRNRLQSLRGEIQQVTTAAGQVDTGAAALKKLQTSYSNFESQLKNIRELATQIGPALAGGQVGSGPSTKATFSQLTELQTRLEGFRNAVKSASNSITQDIARIPGDSGPEFDKLRGQLSAIGNEFRVFGGRAAESLTQVRNRLREIGPLGDVLAQLGLPAALSDLTGRGVALTRIMDGYFNTLSNRYKESIQLTGQLSAALGNFEETLVRFRSGIVTWAIGIQLLGVAVSAPFFISIRAIAEFEDKMRFVQGVMSATEQEFHNLEVAAEAFGRTTRFTGIQAAEALVQLGRAGFQADEAIQALPVTLNLAQAAVIDIGRSTDIVTNIMTAFEIQLGDIGVAVDVLAKAAATSNATIENLGFGFSYIGSVARGLGAEFEDIVGSLAKLNAAGFRGTMAGTALRGALDSLFNPTKDEARVMGELSDRIGSVGLQIRNVQGDFVGFADLIRQLELAGLTSDEALRLFGQRAGPGMAALLRIGSEELGRYVENLENAEGTTADIAAIMGESLQTKFLTLTSAVEGFAISVGKSLSLVLGPLALALADLLNGIVQVREEFPKITAVIDIFVAALASLTLALGTLGFAWALMIIPAKQGWELLRTFIAPMGIVTTLMRKQALEAKRLGKSYDGLQTKQKQVAKEANVLGDPDTWKLADPGTLVAAGVVAGELLGNSFGRSAQDSLEKQQTGLLKNLGIVFVELAKSTVLPLTLAFSGFFAGIASGTGILGKFKALIAGIPLILKGIFEFFVGTKLRIAITSISALLFFFGRNAFSAAKNLQDLAGQANSTGRDMDLLMSRISRTQRELAALGEDADLSEVQKSIKNLNDDIQTFGTLFDRVEKLDIDLSNISFETQINEFGEIEKASIRFGEGLEEIAVLGADSFGNLSDSIKSFEDNFKSVAKAREELFKGFERDAQKRRIEIAVNLVSNAESTFRELQQIQNQIQSLEGFSDVGSVERRNALTSRYIQLNKQVSQQEREIFNALQLQNKSREEQLGILKQVDSQVSSSARTFSEAFSFDGGVENEFIEKQRERLDQAIAQRNVLAEQRGINDEQVRQYDELIRNAEQQLAVQESLVRTTQQSVTLIDRLANNLPNLSDITKGFNLDVVLLRASQRVFSLKGQIKELGDELRSSLEDTQDFLSEAFGIDDQILNANVQKVQDSTDQQLRIEEQALEERKRLVVERVANDAQAAREIEELEIASELRKLELQRESFALQREALEEALERARDLLGENNTQVIEIEKNLANQRRSLLEQEVAANRSVVDRIIDARGKLAAANKKSLDEQKTLTDRLKALELELRHSLGFVSDFGRFIQLRKEVREIEQSMKRAFSAGNFDEVIRLVDEGVSKVQETLQNVPDQSFQFTADVGALQSIRNFGQMAEKAREAQRQAIADQDAGLKQLAETTETELGRLEGALSRTSEEMIRLAQREGEIEGFLEFAKGAKESSTLLEALQQRMNLLKGQMDAGLVANEQKFLGVDPQRIIIVFDEFKEKLAALQTSGPTAGVLGELATSTNDLIRLRDIILELSGVDVFAGIEGGFEQFKTSFTGLQQLAADGLVTQSAVDATVGRLNTVEENLQRVFGGLDEQSLNLAPLINTEALVQNSQQLNEAKQRQIELEQQLSQIDASGDQLDNTEKTIRLYQDMFRLTNEVGDSAIKLAGISDDIRTSGFVADPEELQNIQTQLLNMRQPLEDLATSATSVSLDEGLEFNQTDLDRLNTILLLLDQSISGINFDNAEESSRELAAQLPLIAQQFQLLQDPARITSDQLREQFSNAFDEIAEDIQGLSTSLEALRDYDLGEADLKIEEALAAIEQLQQAYDILKREIEKGITVKINPDGGQTGGVVVGTAQKEGGVVPTIKNMIQRFADGGNVLFKRPTWQKVPGVGSGDRVPAMLEPGEFVLRKRAVQKFGLDFLYKLNSGLLQLKQLGGQVYSTPQILSSSGSMFEPTSAVQRYAAGGEVQQGNTNKLSNAKDLGRLTLALPDGRTGANLYGEMNEIKTFMNKLKKFNSL